MRSPGKLRLHHLGNLVRSLGIVPQLSEYRAQLRQDGLRNLKENGPVWIQFGSPFDIGGIMEIALWHTPRFCAVFFGVEDPQHANGEVEICIVTALDERF